LTILDLSFSTINRHILDTALLSALFVSPSAIPDNVIPIFQPSHSPELNPIERLWEHIKQALSWHTYHNLSQLRNNLKQVLDSLSTEAITSLCGWHYIVSALLSATS
jgi:transposase